MEDAKNEHAESRLRWILHFVIKMSQVEVMEMPSTKQSGRSLAVGLALMAGYVDGYGLFALGTYVSFMSGNTTQTGTMLGQREYMAAMPTALAILFFLLGSIVGNVILHFHLRQAQRILFLWAAGLLGLTVFVMDRSMVGINLPISMLSLAMGSMNTALSRLGAEPVNVTFVTGTLNKLGGHLASAMMRAPLESPEEKWDTHLYRAITLASIWIAFFGGAIISGAAAPYFGTKTLLPPLAALLFLSLIHI